MNDLLIRKATKQDASAIADLLFLAMEDILYEFVQVKSKTKALDFLNHFTASANNQYTYLNCWVGEIDGSVVTCACLYDGANLHTLRKPVKEFIESNYQTDFNPEDETQAGEIYLDCISVSKKQQGKGLGTKILHFLINELVVKQRRTLGLLVDEDNPNAKKLYLKMGFKIVGTKILVGKRMEHLQIS